MNKRKYPLSLFIAGFITNFLFHFFWLIVPGVILLIIGIFNKPCLLIGIALLFLDFVLSLIEQIKIRHTILHSDDPNFRDVQNAILKDKNWMKNIKDLVDEKINNNKQ